VQTFSSGKTLLLDVEKSNPDVVFLDIRMPGDDGLTLARKLQTLENPPLIVFVTAFSDYAVTAFELYALDYLLKPFDDHRVAICVKKLKKVLSSHQAIKETLSAQYAWANEKPVDKIVIKSSTSLRIIPIDHVLWVAANGNYVDIHHKEGKHILRGSLKNIYASLPKSEFIQVHRGFAVRKSLIREVKTISEEKFSLSLATGELLPVGKSYRQNLIESITNNE
jgi:two-component system LytT family response regulator